jgi:hypothetical protein
LSIPTDPVIRPTLTIDSTDAVHRFRTHVWRIGPRRYCDVRVAVPGLPHDVNSKYTMELRGLYFACGCNEGKLGAALACIAAVFWILRQPGALAPLDLAVGIVVTGLGAIAAKFAALAAARRILGRTLLRLEAEIAQATPTAAYLS